MGFVGYRMGVAGYKLLVLFPLVDGTTPVICDGRHPILQTASDLVAIERPLPVE